MSETTFTFRVDESLKQEFSSAAKARDRTGAQLLRDFMRDFVKQQQDPAEHDAWFRRQVQVGLNSANAGRLVAADDVEAEFATRREASLAEGMSAAEIVQDFPTLNEEAVRAVTTFAAASAEEDQPVPARTSRNTR